MLSSLDATVQFAQSEPSLPLCHPLALRVLAALVISRCRLSACGRGGLDIHMSAQVVRVWSPPCAGRRGSAPTPCAYGCSWPHWTPGTAQVWLRNKSPVWTVHKRRRGPCGWGNSGTLACACAFDNDRTAVPAGRLLLGAPVQRLQARAACGLLSPAAVTTLWEIHGRCLCPPPCAFIFAAAAACTSTLKCFCAHHINIIFHSSCFHLFPLYYTRATVFLFCIGFSLCVVIVCCAGCGFQWLSAAAGLRCWGQSSCGLLLLWPAIQLSSLRIFPPRHLLLFPGAHVLPSRIVHAAHQNVFTPFCSLRCLPCLRQICGSKFCHLA
jgi:hypothetical protein